VLFLFKNTLAVWSPVTEEVAGVIKLAVPIPPRNPLEEPSGAVVEPLLVTVPFAFGHKDALPD
jgi:hypothetical protein